MKKRLRTKMALIKTDYEEGSWPPPASHPLLATPSWSPQAGHPKLGTPRANYFILVEIWYRTGNFWPIFMVKIRSETATFSLIFPVLDQISIKT
jgi:hypothetical protein